MKGNLEYKQIPIECLKYEVNIKLKKSLMNVKNKKLPVTVIVPAKNEERNLVACLKTVLWADRVVVVDSQSQDETAKICSENGAELVQFYYDGGWPKKKNWAMRNLKITTPWTMILDADERVSPELLNEISKTISKPEVDGIYMRWKFIFLGRWMRYSWSHGWMLRLFRTSKGTYEDLGMRGEGGWDNEVHENIVIDGITTCLDSHLIHDTNENLTFWIRKQNEFSTWNAVRRIRQLNESPILWSAACSSSPLARRKFLKSLYLRLPCKPLAMFVYLYILKLGFLDGREGFYFCVLRAIHEFNVCAKMFENNQLSN